MSLKNSTYDFLKWVAIVGLHAIGVAYGQLANIWGLPYSSAIPETLDIVGVLLGAFLMWENYDYNKKNGVAPQIPDDKINEEAEGIVNGI